VSKRTKLRTFGVTAFAAGEQARLIVAAYTQREAADLFNLSVYYLRTYGSESMNTLEVSLTQAKPGQVFYRPTRVYRLAFTPLENKRTEKL
jgi:hypothetical protein